uniref:Uncharacterized protein n=1 Tax=Arundo donax TaxID=35708 RepID=A0A0A9B197_ARUDO
MLWLINISEKHTCKIYSKYANKPEKNVESVKNQFDVGTSEDRTINEPEMTLIQKIKQ